MFTLKRIFLTVLILLGLLTVLATWYRYVVLEDFAYTSKPIEEFTEDDL